MEENSLNMPGSNNLKRKLQSLKKQSVCLIMKV